MDQGTDTQNSQEREKAYNRIKLRVSIADMCINIVLLTLLAFSGIADDLAGVLGIVIANKYLLFLAFLAVTGTVFSLAGFPLDFYSSYLLEHRYRLSNQTLPQWLLEKAKGLMVSLAIGVPVALIFYFFLQITGRLWWLYFSAFVFFLSVFLARIAPVVIFPLFYKFKDLDDEEISVRVSSLLERRGINIKGIYTFDMSKNTKKANAGFTGIGRSKRIILSDTLIERFTPDEIAVIFAHEVGHYELKHIARNIIMSTLIIFFSFYLCGMLYELTLAARGYLHVHDIAALPILFLYLAVFGFIIMPLTNFISRRYEVQADAYALKATGDRESFISSMEKLSEINLADRDPHPLTEFIFYSHPSIKKRIDYARNFAG